MIVDLKMDSVYFSPVGEKLRNDPLQGFCVAFLAELRVICEETSRLRIGLCRVFACFFEAAFLFYGYAFCKVARFVDIAATEYRYVICE